MQTVTIFGGTGFVGRSLVQKFAESGALIRVAVRNPFHAQALKPLGEIGQISLIQASISSQSDVLRAIQGSDVVINLVGILAEKGSQTFEAIHVEGAERVAEAAKQQGISTLLHMSALGVSKDSNSKYSSSKARGQEAVLQRFPNATVFRPSVIFGPEDAFLNRFAQMAFASPFLPLIGGGKTKMQPVYVGDVADCFKHASLMEDAKGKIFELGGPSVYTFRELMIYLLKTIQRKRLLLPIPFFAAKALATLAQYLPNAPLTPDQVELLKIDNILSSSSFRAEDLKVRPKALEAIAPLYLGRYRPKGSSSRY